MGLPAILDRTLQRPLSRRALAARHEYYAAGMHRTAGAACYFGVLTLCPFLGLLYLLLAQVAATDPRFLRHSRRCWPRWSVFWWWSDSRRAVGGRGVRRRPEPVGGRRDGAAATALSDPYGIVVVILALMQW
ncbi:MAG TPA: hypothetical protein VG317_06600, partial [Pseudonocardiaceae bacterium]|nr:hypothetical protein [Pseudonocardiaceae bacterium]